MRDFEERRGWWCAVVALAAFSVPGFAGAAPASSPSYSRTTVVPIDQYHRESRIVRERSVGKEHVRFSADAQPIGPGAAVKFEIRSMNGDKAVVRWRCTATDDVSECFERPIRVRYLPNDTQVVLSIEVVPQDEAQRYAVRR